MQERLRADEAALRAKERERSKLLTEKDRVLGLKETGKRLVDAFHQLEADGDMNSDDATAMMQAIAAWMNNFGGGHGNCGGGVAGV